MLMTAREIHDQNTATALACDIRAAVEAAPIALVRAYVENDCLTEEDVDTLPDSDVVDAMVAFLALGVEEGIVTHKQAMRFFAPGGMGR